MCVTLLDLCPGGESQTPCFRDLKRFQTLPGLFTTWPHLLEFGMAVRASRQPCEAPATCGEATKLKLPDARFSYTPSVTAPR